MPYKKTATSSFPKKRPPLPQAYHSRINPMKVKEGTKDAILAPTKRQERKFDGSRSMVIKDFEKVQIMGSRNWVNDYGLGHPELVAAVQALPVDRAILDAEFTFFKKGTDRDFFLNAMSGPETIAEYDGVAKLVVFDVLYVDSDSLEHLPYDDRKEILHTIIPKNTEFLIVPKTVKAVKDKVKQVKELEERKLEGVVEKEADSPYREGAETEEWLKLKNWKTDDVVVFGATVGNGKNASTFGSVLVAQRDKDGKLRYVGKAAGFKGFEADKMVNLLKKNKVSKCPGIIGLPEDVSREVQNWCKPVQDGVIEVKYLNRMEKSGLLRMPDFFRWRPDKPLKDVRIPT